MDNHDKIVMKLLTQLTKELDGFLPLEVPKSSETLQRFSLAEMYANKGFRDYMVSNLKRQKSSLSDAVDLKGLWVQKGRIEILTEILRVSKQMFEESEKLKGSLVNKLAD